MVGLALSKMPKSNFDHYWTGLNLINNEAQRIEECGETKHWILKAVNPMKPVTALDVIKLQETL